MKNNLLNLINQIEDIKTHFHVMRVDGIPCVNTIYDTTEFSVWKQEVQLELQDIYDCTNNQFIWNTLVNLKQGFNGWKDETSFNELSGSLYAIRKNINRYYPVEITEKKEKQELFAKPQLLISHNELDKSYVSALVDLFEDIGLDRQQIVCSSIPGCRIPLGQDIY